MCEETKPDALQNASDVVETAPQAVNDTVVPAQEPKEEPVVEDASSVQVEEPAAQQTEAPLTEDVPQCEASEEEPAAEQTPVEPAAEAEQAQKAEEESPVAEEPKINYAELTLAELVELFQKLSADEDRMKKYKEADAIKAAFYKKLSKEKAEAGLSADVDEPSSEVEETPAETEQSVSEEKVNPFEAIESGFKALYNYFKKERAEYNREQDKLREENLVKKQAIIEELKALVEKPEDAKSAFPDFRALQARWREAGPVPTANFRDINDTYQFYVEQFYDKVELSRAMRDLDFKKNLEVKEGFCEAAEELCRKENIVEAFKELQKLHEQWKEYGPVAKEHRIDIWERFKAATAVINRKYQAHFEGLKEQQAANLVAKTGLCEQVEAIAAKEDIKSTNEWAALSKQIEEIQQQWRKIGFASKKDNQKIYDRFRAACDKFFERKRVYYNETKGLMNENLAKKMALIEKAESLKGSTDRKATISQLIELQKQWKEIGAVPRKRSEEIWKRFRAACDEFFDKKGPAEGKGSDNDFYANMKAKKALIAEINAFNTEDEQLLKDAAETFTTKWAAIGFVPFKEKEAINAAFKEAMQAKFPDYQSRGGARKERRGPASSSASSRAPLSEKDKLIRQYNALQQDIVTYENNIGFFSASKNSAPLIKQMEDRIAQAKSELKDLETKIKSLGEE